MQSDLFKTHVEANCCRHDLAGAALLEFPYAIAEQKALRYFQQLQNDLPWEQVSIRIAGKLIPIPRLQCWIGDADTAYSYSGLRLTVFPWVAPVLAIKDRVEHLCRQSFNSVLVNYYRDGRDSVSWHSDDEPELGLDPVVASLSLGASRVFELKHKTQKTLGKFAITLHSGSLLVMGKGTQINWLHQIPKARNVHAPRINLTFRWVNPTGGKSVISKG